MENRAYILARLLEKVQRGDSGASEKLCRELEKDIRGYFENRFHDPALIDDLCQETYLRLLTSLAAVEKRMKLTSFVASVAFHVMQDHFRQKYRKRVQRLEASYDSINCSEVKSQVNPGRANPRHIPQDENILDEIAVEEALQQLPEKTRTILTLKSQGYTYEEIADAVALSLSGVKMQVKRSIEHLKFILLDVTYLCLTTTILMRYIYG